jgi:hypothetical protein
MILKSELNAGNKITAIGALAVPVLRYSFGIINWRIEEIKQIDRKTRKMLTLNKMHHPKAEIDRLYVKRKEGGRELVQVEATYKAGIINIAEYLNSPPRWGFDVPLATALSKIFLLRILSDS